MHVSADTVTAESWVGESFWLCPHMHVCVTLDGSVVLDLKRDKYFGLGKQATELLAAAVVDWPTPAWSALGQWSGVAAGEALRLCQSLVEDGWLTRQEPRQGARRATRVDMRAEFIAVGDELEVSGRVTAGHVSRFVGAYLWARWSLGRGSLCAAVEAIRLEKVCGKAAAVACDIGQVAGLVEVFRRLRPFVFAAEGRCLLHALTLTRFLACYGLHPDWVIGVTTQPWAAHSWVQWGNYLLDTNPEKVCHFTPIMVV